MAKPRIPLPKQTEQVFKDKKKYDRKVSKKLVKAVRDDVCPDCLEPAPHDRIPGSTCCICGHKF